VPRTTKLCPPVSFTPSLQVPVPAAPCGSSRDSPRTQQPTRSSSGRGGDTDPVASATALHMDFLDLCGPATIGLERKDPCRYSQLRDSMTVKQRSVFLLTQSLVVDRGNTAVTEPVPLAGAVLSTGRHHNPAGEPGGVMGTVPKALDRFLSNIHPQCRRARMSWRGLHRRGVIRPQAPCRGAASRPGSCAGRRPDPAGGESSRSR
jgi:hypothetical protein